MRLEFCVACGTTNDLNNHHLKPKSLGGSDDDTNLITLCRECHGIIHGSEWENQHSNLTKQGLERAKARGVRLGACPGTTRLVAHSTAAAGKSVEVRKAKADEFAAAMAPIFNQLRNEGFTSNTGLADELNRRGIKTARGGSWHATAITRILSRLQARTAP